MMEALLSPYQVLEAQWPSKKRKPKEIVADELDLEDLISAISFLFKEENIVQSPVAESEEQELEDLVLAVGQLFNEDNIPHYPAMQQSVSAVTTKRQLLGPNDDPRHPDFPSSSAAIPTSPSSFRAQTAILVRLTVMVTLGDLGKGPSVPQHPNSSTNTLGSGGLSLPPVPSKDSCGPAAHGRVEELLVAEELWNDHKKPFFFPFSSAATCTNHPLEVDQRSAIQGTVLALSEPGTDLVNATARYVAFRGLIGTYPLSLSQGDMRSIAIYLPDLTSLSRCLHTCVAFWARPVTFLT
ncbi:hypothetical protein Taro_001842 [Colocasia esculenta]|uniref:Uncharacterized protein n=1 Tax=Colocasia esculenta TaxID=4460 RepID=A0A843TJ84_COLES|nr:hypothetical protein [Colocasia esculenta]